VVSKRSTSAGAPAPLPPPSMVMAGIPRAIAALASVDPSRSPAVPPTATVAAFAARTMAEVSAVAPAGRSPTTVSVADTWPGLLQRAFSAATA
jgi:hypothetical protein